MRPVDQIDEREGKVVSVRLDGEDSTVFPLGCCVCDRRVSEGTLTLEERSRSLSELLLRWGWRASRWVKVSIPICSGCRADLVAQRRWRIFWMGSLVLVGVFGAMAWAKSIGLTRGLVRLVGLAGGSLGLGAGFAWYWFRPLPFDLTVQQDYVVYRFASRGYAARFLACNPQGRRV